MRRNAAGSTDESAPSASVSQSGLLPVSRRAAPCFTKCQMDVSDVVFRFPSTAFPPPRKHRPPLCLRRSASSASLKTATDLTAWILITSSIVWFLEVITRLFFVWQCFRNILRLWQQFSLTVCLSDIQIWNALSTVMFICDIKKTVFVTFLNGCLFYCFHYWSPVYETVL